MTRDLVGHRCAYPFSPSSVSSARSTLRAESDLRSALTRLVEKPSGVPDGLFLGLVATFGAEPHASDIAELLDIAPHEVEQQLSKLLGSHLDSELRLTGAEAIALTLARESVGLAFAYPGTSELCLCDAIHRLPDTRLVNGRGDKESAFMAAGACLMRPIHAVAVLHGARGVTNAAGAIADTLRNEVPTVFLAGLPSTSSAPFLPPHGERGLIEAMDHLVKWSHEYAAVSTEEVGPDSARAFTRALEVGFQRARQAPRGPVLVGVPQDVSEASCIPWSAFSPGERLPTADPTGRDDIVQAAEWILSHRRPVILIDDYLLKLEDAKGALREFAARSRAPVFQVRYRRGPMLFERLHGSAVPNFVGWLDQSNPTQRSILHSADLLITIEDRNMYRRVIGDLPRCRVIAINSNAGKVRKNLYVSEEDLLVESNPVLAMRSISIELEERGDRGSSAVRLEVESGAEAATPVQRLRREIVRALADALEECANPVLVDDSQMFGGLVAQNYDELPPRVRVFGDHGGFVGSGISYATGLALADASIRVVCLLGDQAFANGLQGLIAAGEQRAPALYVVCNNGSSVSLSQQSQASNDRWLEAARAHFLGNAVTLGYAGVLAAMGVDPIVLDLSGLAEDSRSELSQLKDALRKAIASDGPVLVDLRLPSDPEFWAGIWQTRGLDEVSKPEGGGASDPDQRR